MRIGVNAGFKMHGGGMVHLRHLLKAWRESGVLQRHEIVLITRAESLPYLQIADPSCVDIKLVHVGDSLTQSRFIWEQMRLLQVAGAANLDVLYCPGGVVPLFSRTPTVVSLRNAAPFCDALTVGMHGVQGQIYNRVLGSAMRLSARSARRVIFISHFFRNLFESRFGFPPERSDVIYHGRDGLCNLERDASVLDTMGIRRPFLLSLSHLYPYKNIPDLIRGFGSIRKLVQERDLRLVLVGKPSTEEYGRALRALVRDLGLESWVLLTGPVRHDQIASLMAECSGFIFQSLVENCPNTLIEAMAMALPIACSNAGVMPEIAGEAAIYFDPMSPDAIAAALESLITNPGLRAELSERARAQALKFPTWREVGALTLASLERAAGSSSRA